MIETNEKEEFDYEEFERTAIQGLYERMESCPRRAWEMSHWNSKND